MPLPPGLDPNSPLALSGHFQAEPGSDEEVEDHEFALQEEKRKEAAFFEQEKQNGLEHNDTLTSFFALFDCWIKLYRLNKISDQLERILPICRKKGGQFKIKAVQASAFVLWKRGRFSEAVKLFHEMEELVGKTAALCENIGHTYSSLGDYPQAERYFSDALDCLNDPEVVLKQGEGNKGGVLLGLGLIRERLGKFRDALPVVEQAYDFYKRRAQLPGGQPSLQAKAAMSCAKLHAKLKEFSMAEQYCEEAISLFEVTCGEDSPLTAGAYFDYANILWQQTKVEATRNAAKKAYEIEILKDAFDLMTVLQTHNLLMETHLKAADQSIDRTAFKDYFPIVENTMVRVRRLPQDGNAGVYYKAAGECYMWGGDYKRAKELLEESQLLLAAETSCDCSQLVTECGTLVQFCERNLNGKQDSPMQFDLTGMRDRQAAPKEPKIEELPDDDEEDECDEVDGVLIEEVDKKAPGFVPPARDKAPVVANKYAGGAVVRVLSESHWPGVVALCAPAVKSEQIEALPELPRAAKALDQRFGRVACDPASNRVVGVVLCTTDGYLGYLHFVVVHPDWRRKGLARQLVKESVACLATSGISRVQTAASPTNALAKSLLKALGWQQRRDLRWWT